MGVYMSGIAAQAIEISVNNRGKLKVERVDCVIDCGRYVNPNIIKSQVEGGIIMGLSSTISEKITFENGQVVQGNFDEYKIIRMKDIPEINIHLIESNEKPGGIGETGNPPVAPALTNAIFAATGKRIRKLPIGKQKLV
jgi:isoquinoline 1-oxidoreductase beta subunit